MNKYEIKLNETEYVTVVFDTSIEPEIIVLRLQRVHRRNKELKRCQTLNVYTKNDKGKKRFIRPALPV